MNNSSKEEVVGKIRAAEYGPLFQTIFGSDVFGDAETAFAHVTEAIAAFENSSELSSFSSRYDAYLRGHEALTAQELRGLALFNDPAKGNCAACHPSEPSDNGVPPLFTDFSYDNIGLPKNFASPFLSQPSEVNPGGGNFVDLGLQETTGRPGDAGRFKVPTLRNAAVTAPYFHNGVFSTLEEVVHFYNRRDSERVIPEVSDGVNKDELGDLRLSSDEEADIVAFLKTLTDE